MSEKITRLCDYCGVKTNKIQLCFCQIYIDGNRTGDFLTYPTYDFCSSACIASYVDRLQKLQEKQNE